MVSVTGRSAAAGHQGWPEPDLLRLDRSLERGALAEVAVLEAGRDGRSRSVRVAVGLGLEGLEEEVGEGAVDRPANVASEAVWSACTRRTARASLRWCGSSSARRAPCGRRCAGGGRRGCARVWARPPASAAAGSAGAAEQLGLHDLVEVLEAGAAVARVEEHLEEHAGRHRAKRSCSSSSTITVSRSHWSPF